MSTWKYSFSSAICLTLLLAGLSTTCPAEEKPSGKKEAEWIPLFDGKTLNGWKKTNFGGPGEVSVEDGAMVIEMSAPLNGVTMTEEAFKKLPKGNYEIKLQAQRALGGDFFVGLTVPVKDAHCSLIMGGWGGGVIGISSLNGYDASENETTTYATFEKGKWYDVRMKVTDKKIVVWLDDEEVINVDIEDSKISTRIEVDLSTPVGLATFETTAKIRNFMMRPLSE